jgi:hypothetical protein
MSPEELKRLWEFTLHEDQLFNERQNLFLIAQSMLAVAYTTALVAKDDGIARAIAIVALIVSVMWVYVSIRHTRIVALIQAKAKEVFPEYSAITAARDFPWTPWPSRYVVAYGVPPAIGALWMVLLIARL